MLVSEFASLLTAITTVVYTIGTFMLWRTTKKTTQLVESQVSAQIRSSYSSAHHSVLDGHRSLFLELIKTDELLNVLAKETGKDKEIVQKRFLASMMINQVLRVFLDYERNVALDKSINSFDADARDLFSFPFIRERWNEVKYFHPANFRNYIDSKIVSRSDQFT
jgi:hypothetical protein